MMRRARKALRVLLDLELAVNSLTTYSDDTFLVGYPKSGSTWLRFLVGNLLNPDPPIDFANLESRVPDIYRNLDRTIRAIVRPRYLKSHEPFTPDYKKVVYIVRDPRDVAVSYYYHQIKFQQLPRGSSVSNFITSLLDGEVDSYGTWSEHVGGWLGSSQDKNGFLLVRYEDLQADPLSELNAIARFIGLTKTVDELQQAADLSTFDRMRRLEQVQFSEWKSIAGSLESERFIRAGKVGGWRDELTTKQADMISNRWHEPMAKTGYSTAQLTRFA